MVTTLEIDSMEEIRRLFESADEHDRLRAAIALGRSALPEAAEMLRLLASADPANRVRYAARKLLAVMRLSADDRDEAGRIELTDPSPERRVLAIEAAAAAGESGRLPALLAHLDDESDPSVIASLVKAIGALGGPSQISLLGTFLRDADPRVRANAVDALSAIGEPVGLALLIPLLQDDDHRVQASVAAALTAAGYENTLEILERMIASGHVWMRDSAAYALALTPVPEAVELLGRLLTDHSRSVREKAQHGLEKLARSGTRRAAQLLDGLAHVAPAEDTMEAVEGLIEDRAPGHERLTCADPRLRMNIVNTIISELDVASLAGLLEHLELEENEFVLSRVIAAVGVLGAGRSGAYGAIVANYLDSDDPRVVANALDTLRALGEPLGRDAHGRPVHAACGHVADEDSGARRSRRSARLPAGPGGPGG
ncbi:MAG: HEAT repeat domain-containing protein [Candidatus Riflebacteria bacterium]|nr:HEAT repeat domain-containing protein [Candidatus Riflebacteria bacterium]